MLSILVAIKAAATEIGTARPLINPIDQPYNDKSKPPTAAAAVPSADTAPSVPGSTLSNVVIKNVVLPYAFPISEAKVSANFVAKEATYPSRKRSDVIPKKVGPRTEQSAQASPVAADPLCEKNF